MSQVIFLSILICIMDCYCIMRMFTNKTNNGMSDFSSI